MERRRIFVKKNVIPFSIEAAGVGGLLIKGILLNKEVTTFEAWFVGLFVGAGMVVAKKK